MKHLTIRNVSPELSEALNSEKSKLELSLNATVLYLLTQHLGLTDNTGSKSNGIEHLAGGWSKRELKNFNDKLAQIRRIEKV